MASTLDSFPNGAVGFLASDTVHLIVQFLAFYGKTMTLDEYEKLPVAEQKFFMQCPDCRELFDLRNLEEIVFHLAHRNPPLPAFRIDDSKFFSGATDTEQQALWRRLLNISRRRDSITKGANPIPARKRNRPLPS